jgi:hypothetical protein
MYTVQSELHATPQSAALEVAQALPVPVTDNTTDAQDDDMDQPKD